MKTNDGVIKLITISVVLGKIIRREYDSRRKNGFAEQNSGT